MTDYCVICQNEGNLVPLPVDWREFKKMTHGKGSPAVSFYGMVPFYTIPHELQTKIREMSQRRREHYDIRDGDAICASCYAQAEHDKWTDDVMVCKDCRQPLTKLGQGDGFEFYLWGCSKCRKVYFEPTYQPSDEP